MVPDPSSKALPHSQEGLWSENLPVCETLSKSAGLLQERSWVYPESLQTDREKSSTKSKAPYLQRAHTCWEPQDEEQRLLIRTPQYDGEDGAPLWEILWVQLGTEEL